MYGFKVVESSLLVDHHSKQTKFPRSKKRRIQKKFRKKYTIQWTTPSQEVMISETTRTIFCHPEVADTIRKYIAPAPVEPSAFRNHLFGSWRV